MPDLFRGRFRKVYVVTKVVTVYVGGYLVFFFWPLFLGKLMMPGFLSELEVIAGSFLTPLGFLCVGGYFGRKTIGLHIVILLLISAITWFVWPSDLNFDPPNLYERFVPMMIFGYALGMVAGLFAEFRRQPESRLTAELELNLE